MTNCKSCELDENGCAIQNEEGYRKGGCGAGIERKEK